MSLAIVFGAGYLPLLLGGLAKPEQIPFASAGVGVRRTWWWVPAATPRPIVKKLNAEVNHVLKLPEVKQGKGAPARLAITEDGLD